MLNQQANCYYFIGFYILLIIFMIIKETDSIYNDNNIRDSIDNNSNQSINSNEHSSKIYHLNIGAVLSNHLHTLNFIQVSLVQFAIIFHNAIIVLNSIK